MLTISQTVRQQVQNRTAVGVPCAPGGPPAACGNPSQSAAALTNRSIYNVNLPGFEIRSRRDTASFRLAYEATQNLDVNIWFSTTGKTGHQPWSASFAFNNANEVPLPLDNRTNDISAGVEWANRKGMVRLAWDGSFFNNNLQTLTWDNPIRATDFNNGLLPPNGPYDPNGYSNGNGPAQGRMALPPRQQHERCQRHGSLQDGAPHGGQRNAAVHDPESQSKRSFRGQSIRSLRAPSSMRVSSFATLAAQHGRG